MITDCCHNRKTPLLAFFLFIVAISTSLAQTVDCSNNANCADPYCAPNAGDGLEKGCECFDGADNDGDGRIDKADSNCATYYGLTFVGEGSDCSLVPPGANTPFDLIGAPAVSGQNTADTQSKVAVGDVDGDGIPDVVITSKWNSEIRVVATSNGQPDGSDAGDVKGDYNLDGSKIFSGSGACDPKNLLFEHEVLIADIDKDGDAEIFGVVSNRLGSPKSPPTCFFLVGFRYGPGPGGLIPMYNAIQIGTDRPGTFGIADMDGDGRAEIYMRDRIYAAETGALLATGNGDWDLDITSAPVAVNIVGDTKMELVCGTKIFSINSLNLTTRNPGAPQNMTPALDMNTSALDKCFVKLMLDPVEYGLDTHSSTSVADIDSDGSIDVVISGALNSVSGKTAVFYWNVAKNTTSYFIPPDGTYADGWPWGTGRVNLRDIDNDHKLEMFFIAGNQLFCIQTDASGAILAGPNTYKWKRVINDSRSGVLTVTIYDFDNNGEFELVYRDSQELAIVDAETGSTKFWSATCQSHTYTEGPVIADVNGDGGTDICVACNRNNSFNINADIQQQALGEVRLFFSSGNEWLPTRKVWNQPGYFVVNINDDLTLPFPQLDQQLVFSNDDCSNGLSGPQQPLNTFLNQIPFLSSTGCPVYPAPDLSFVGDDPENLPFPPGDPRNFPAVIVTPPICGNLDIKVQFNIINDGDLPISDNIPVSFFHGDPTQPSITSDSLLFSTTLSVVNLAVGDTLTTAPISFNGPGTPFRLYIVLNNNGSVLPIDPAGSVTNECRIDNNIYDVFVNPTPFTASIEKIKDNDKCTDAAPNTGELRAHIFIGATEVADYSPYAFSWTNSSNVVVSTNYNAVGLPEDTYTLIVTNTQKGCSAAPVVATIDRVNIPPALAINILSHQTKCSPADGQLQAVINGSTVTTGYTIKWFEEASEIGITGPIATGLGNPNNPNYFFSAEINGCVYVSTPIKINQPPIPDTQTSSTDVVNCLTPASGTVSAVALVNGVPAVDQNNFTFNWYFYDSGTGTKGSILPPANGTGANRTGLVAGSYLVEITDNTTNCQDQTPPVVDILSSTVIPTVGLTPGIQTSCDPLNPNGTIAAAGLLNGGAATLTYEWFLGDNTIAPAIKTESSATGSTLTNALGSGQIYTVKVTTNLDCSATEKTIVPDNINIPVVTLTPANNTICDPALNFDGSVSAAVSFDGNPVVDFTNYTFTWHDGSLISDPAPSPNSTSTFLDQQNAGFYTLEVERTDLHCKSVPVTAQVLDVLDIPDLNTNAIPSTNCTAAANGQAIITDVDGVVVPGSGVLAPYSFQWHTGNTTAVPIAGATDGVLENVQGAAGTFFTVLVVNQNNGCSNTAVVEVTDAKVIPLPSLTPTPNNICDPALTNPSVQFNGKVESVLTNQGTFPITDFEFTWTDEETGAQVLQATGAGGQNLINRDSSYYILIVEQLSTGCQSDPVTAQVVPAQILPVITADANTSTNCTPALANGGVQVTDVDGLGLPANYTFEWHMGSTLAGAIIAQAAASPDTLQGAVGKFYTVLVTNQNDGCQSTEVVEVPDARIIPLVTLTASPNNICDPALTNPPVPFNGTVGSSITNLGGLGINDYQFTWTDEENGSQILQQTGAAGQSLIELDSSYYTVVVQQLSTGCTSSPVTAQVTPNQALPLITADANASTNCDPLLANGGVQVTDVDGLGLPANFSFEWHLGTTLTGIKIANAAASPDTLQGATGKFYTVLVTNKSDGCQNTQIVEVPDMRTLPVISLVATDNKNCAGTPDGTASLNSITYDGITTNAPSAFAGYSFDWSSGETTQAINQKAAAFYTLTVTKDDVGCISDPVSIEVKDDFTYPAILLTPTPQTSCDIANLNGQLSAAVDVAGVPTTAGFAYAWFSGSNTSTTLNPANVDPVNSFHAINLPGAVFYTIEVTNNTTLCATTETIFLQENIAIPRIELVPTDVLDCNTDGFITANVFIDLNNDGTEDVLPAGDYPNYQFSWFKGSDTSAPQLVNTTTRLLQFLDDGVTPIPVQNYTAFVVNTLTSCTSAEMTTLLNGPPPLFDLDFNVNFKPASCATDEGVITAFVTTGGPTTAGYTFEWYEGSITNGLQVPPPSFYTDPPVTFNGSALAIDPLSLFGTAAFPAGQPLPNHQAPTGAATGPTLYGRSSGTYTVVATRNADGCKEYLTTYLPFQAEPVIIVAEIKPDDCLGDHGEVIVDITVPATSTPNQYKVWLIPGSNPTLIPASNPVPVGAVIDPAAAVNNSFTGLDAGVYTVVAQEDVADIPSGCFSAPVQVELREALPPLLDALSTSFSTSCGTAPGDGSLEITFATDPSDPFNPGFPPPPPPTIYLPAVQKYSVEVEDASSNSVFTTGGYTNNSGDNVIIPGLANGDFTVTVESSQGCSITKTFTVPWNPQVAEIVDGDVAVLNALYCDPLLETNARAEVTKVSIIGGGADNIGDYNFDWFTDINLTTNVYSAVGDGSGTPLVAPFLGETFANGVNGVAAGTVKAGSYWVVATKVTGSDGIGCFSAPFKIDIVDDSVDPTFGLTPFSNTACDANFEGRISLVVSDPGSVASPSYTYDWDNSNPTDIENGLGPVGGNNGDGDGTEPDGDNPGNLSDGTYKVTITNDASGCAASGQTTITKTTTPIIVASATPVNQFICNPDGSITVNDVLVGGVVDPLHTNFDFTWFRNDLSNIVINAVNNEDVLDIANLPTIGAGTYFVKAKRTSGIQPGSGCESAPLRVDILDESVDPTFTLTPFSNTACDANFEGRLNLTVTNAGSAATPTYSYAWYPANPTAIAFNSGNGDGLNVDENYVSLSDGTYKVTITNDASGCTASGQTTITKTTTPIIIASATPVNQFICNPDGSITVNDVLVGGVVDPLHTNFDFTWFRNDLSTIVINAVNNEDVLDIANLPTISAGTYFVKAKRTSGIQPGSGCESAPLRVDILDESVDPTFTLTPFSNTACDANFEGRISLVVTSPGSVPTVTYTYDWDNSNPTDIENGLGPVGGNNGDGDGTEPDGDNPGGLSDGTYKVTITNDASGCTASGQTTITKTTTPIIIASATPVNQFICNPDGSITVNDVLVGGVVGPLHTNFDFTWFRNDLSTIVINAVNNEDVLDIANLPTISAGTYFVKAKRTSGIQPGSGCESAPLRVDILDESVDPDMTFTSVPNSSCNNLNPNAVILATAAERDGTTDNYTFNWLLDNSALPPVTVQTDVSPTSQLTSAFNGTYALTITNTVTGCTFTKDHVILLDQTISLPNILQTTTIDPTNCLGSGSAEVVSITIGGQLPPFAGNDPRFTFDWFTESNFPGTPDPVQNTHQFTGLNPGKYFVIVTDQNTECPSAPTEVVINENAIVYPDLRVQQTKKQISCLTPSGVGSAELLATADGFDDSNPIYQFEWFKNLDYIPPVFQTTSSISNLIAGSYSVKVLNTATGCTDSTIYIIPDEVPLYSPLLVITPQAVTNCLVADGSIVVRNIAEYGVLDDPGSTTDVPDYPFSSLNFQAEYYTGQNPNTTVPGLPMTDIVGASKPSWTETGLANGVQYTVKVTDTNTGCFTLIADVVPDGRLYPVVAITEDNPLINCDTSNPNGQLSATADGGQVGGYSFEWYRGQTATGSVLSNNNKLIAQTIDIYTVHVTNNLTGCSTDGNGNITDGRILPVVPTAVLVQDRTHCITPDGWVAANVNGNTINYTFDWFDGSTVGGTPDFTGVNYINRDVGTYTVTAMDIITGCISPPASINVADARVFPELIFTTTPSYCEDVPTELGGGQGTGTIELQLSPADLVSDSIVWTFVADGTPVGLGMYLTGVYPGFYQADVLTSKGCPGTGTTEVKTEIRSYNLVSVNSDQKNDKFIIDCISRFTIKGGAERDNNVKIFNRAGILVYEADGYDNGDIVFSGYGENGVYPAGNLLPVGTYFYIIDKRDGTKPKTGYLELVR